MYCNMNVLQCSCTTLLRACSLHTVKALQQEEQYQTRAQNTDLGGAGCRYYYQAPPSTLSNPLLYIATTFQCNILICTEHFSYHLQFYGYAAMLYNCIMFYNALIMQYVRSKS